ncbi:MAG: peptidyl-prolyl cis-trans isomerase [Alphaproteobacteria bacterium]|nr:peptidyl-prolyl cis-trans isomerase [Alphaproteobacteria bacterium]
MLQSMRNLTKSWIFKSLMFLLVISFSIWGIGDMFRSNPATRVVASVGKVKIQVQELERRFQTEMQEARAAFGPEFSIAQARQAGLLDRTLALMIQESQFDQDAARLGINVPRDLILQTLAQEPKFRTPEGKFNVALLHQLLGRAGLNEEMFFDLETRSEARKAIADVIMASAQTPQIMTNTLYQARGAKRILEVITLRNDSVKGLKPATDDELQTYYKEHEADFMAPEYRGITIAHLTSEDITKDITVSDEDIQKSYDERAAEMVVPESRDLVQVVLQDEAKAKSIAETASTLRSLPQAAKAKGVTPITMNKIDAKAILPELSAAVFALKQGDVTAPIKSSLGWHIVQLNKIHEKNTLTLDQAKDDLRKTLQEERTGDMIAKTINQLDDAIAGNQPLEDIANTLRLRLTRYAALDATGKLPNGTAPKEAIPAKEITLASAQSLDAGETGQVLEDGKGNYYVVRVDQVTPSQTRTYAEAKDQVLAAWTEEKLFAKAAAVAEDIAKQLREGKSATSFASMPGVDVRLSKPMSILSAPDKALPPEIIPQVTHMKKGDVTLAARQGKHTIVRLADIVPVDPQKPESSRLKIVDDLRKKLPDNMIEQYIGYMNTLFPQQIDMELLTSLKSQG